MSFLHDVDDYVRHLAEVRRLSPATVKAYASDLRDLAATTGIEDTRTVGLEDLRDWLWAATNRGEARSTIARRAAAAPRFFSGGEGVGRGEGEPPGGT